MWEKITRSRWLGLSFLGSFLLVFGGFLWSFFSLRGIPQPLIVHFSRVDGITQIGGMGDLAVIAGIPLVALVINFFIALELDVRDKFLSRLVAFATLFLSVLIFFVFKAIINVNY